VRFCQAPFETWEAPATAFDLVLAGTALHWIAPEIAFPKAARLLRDSGHLAIFANELRGHTPGFTDDLYELEQPLVPTWPDPRTLPEPTAQIPDDVAMLAATRLFAPALVRTYAWELTYPVDVYLRLLNTNSNYRSLPGPTRTALLDAIGELIARRYAGSIVRSYLSILYLARKAVAS
jgi:SAM-dependent methyltransferase